MLALAALALASDASLGVHDPLLAAVLEEHWTAQMYVSPVWATQLGDHRYDTRLDDNSEAARKRWQDKRQSYADRARKLAGLAPGDALTRDLLVAKLDDELRVERECRFAEWSFSARSNALVYAADLGRAHAVKTVDDAGNLVARYQKLPGWIDTEVRNLRLGLDDGLVANRASVEKVIAMVDEELAAAEPDSALAAPLREAYPIPGDKLGAFHAGLRQALPPVRAALQRYRDFLHAEILPRARGDGLEGLAALPLEGCYAARVRQETTKELDPDTLHQKGLDELERIHAEMAPVGEKLFGTTRKSEIFSRLRSDPALHFDTREAVEQKAREALSRAQAAVPRVFGTLPKAECVVKPIPDHEAPYTTIAYYWQAAPDGSEPGVYYVNTWQPTTRTRFDAEVLAFHEAVPGHHLQIAIARELQGVPSFRRFDELTVFIEGWALYSERLSDELGLYSGDLDRMGMLGFDAWRASRLVVDTGIHAMGWSRGEAEDFLRENTPLAENNIVNEVDRYITWPGQALGYKLGQFEIRRLRAEAEQALGSRFDLAGFHDTVLGAGAVPMAVLEARVRGWVESRK
ncbi:MAG: DUF885 domain-containing protein [Deltaproteobacteria bacterium]|nr:DUF885 domain-containing protein [Deltaproteobacteria bacterium]